MRISRCGKTLGVLLGTIFWLICLIAPQTGLAKIRCQRGSAGVVLTVSVTEGTFATVRRAGERIEVRDLLADRRGCETGATVTNTDRIKIFASSGSSASVELANGPFAPGLSADEDAASEIEFEVSGDGYVEVIGGRGPDHFRYMDSGADSGVNLNPDEDEDLDLAVAPDSREMLFVVSGGGGNDRIDALGSPALEIYASGGDGNDTLVAAPTGSILEGERGSDRLIGGPALDFAIPGRGADRATLRGGSDLVEMTPDHSRDRIDCGSGHDFVAGAERFDRLSRCN
jgi:Ca2+-binding RTX toxin-like protein